MTTQIESLVRTLIGLPIAVAYFYVRHFDERYAYLSLVLGLALLISALEHELSAAYIARRRP